MKSYEVMELAAKMAEVTMCLGNGGPFGAAIVKDGEVVCVASNSVLESNDATAHAEVNAIRMAGRKLGTYDLTGCELYATGFPCPMCMAATIWANIKKVYVSGSPKDAEEIGFRDDFIYKFIEDECSNPDIVEIEHLDSSIARNLYTGYVESQKTIY